MSQFFRDRTAGLIGNILEHYDHALFGLLAPFIAPLFFEGDDPLTALILTYAILPLGLLTKPIGSLFFGWIGDRIGRREALFYSLLGMAIVTVAIGSLPTFAQAGIWAPISLATAKMLQSFFAAGESAGSPIFVLEQTSLAKRSLFSSFCGASTMVGILIASGLVTFLSSQGMIETGWRVLFWLGGFTALIGVYFRLKTEEREESLQKQKFRFFEQLYEYKGALLSIIIVSGFSYATYSLSFTLMNGLIPLIAPFSKAEVMKMNTALLGIDLLLLPCFGALASKWGKERVMLSAALLLSFGALPLFYLLSSTHLWTLLAVRSTLVTLGVAFAAPCHAWVLERVPASHRYLILSFGSALGSQLIGSPTSAICLWFYKQTGSNLAPGVYLTVIAALAAYAIHREKKRETVKRALEIQTPF